LSDTTRQLVKNDYQFQINKDMISIYGAKEAERIYIKVGKVGVFHLTLILFTTAQGPSVPAHHHYRGFPITLSETKQTE
jgi:quercetin dioxygenase-like cupin family protein